MGEGKSGSSVEREDIYVLVGFLLVPPQTIY